MEKKKLSDKELLKLLNVDSKTLARTDWKYDYDSN